MIPNGGRSLEGARETMDPTNDPFNLIGQTLAGKYRIDSILGEGGFGVVYGGTHLLIGAPIAIKRMKPLGGSPQEEARALERFLREARILFTLTHPGIVRLYDLGTVTAAAGTVPYVVLEQLPGGSLESEIAARVASTPQRPFTAAEILGIFEPVLDAVEYAHLNGVAHRDLKPSNVMLAHGGSRGIQAKVVDFGIARWMGDEQKTVLGASAFTPRYAAPEQWDGTLGPTGAASDVFSLGLMLAEVCTLSPVIPDAGPAQMFADVMRRERRLDLARLRPDLPAHLERVIARAMHVDPRGRFQSAGELLSELRSALRGSSPDLGSLTPRSGPRSSPMSTDKTELASAEANAIVSPREGPVPPSMTTPSMPRVLCSDESHCTGTWGRFFMVVWKGSTTVEAARAIQYGLRDFAAGHGGQRVVLITVVEASAPLPNADARTALSNILRFCADDVLCSGVAMEGDGFRAAAVRGVATGLSLVARQPFPHQVFASVGQAAAWVTRHVNKQSPSKPMAASDIERAVDCLRRGEASSLPERVEGGFRTA